MPYMQFAPSRRLPSNIRTNIRTVTPNPSTCHVRWTVPVLAAAAVLICILGATERWRLTAAAAAVPHDLVLRDDAVPGTVYFVVTASLTTSGSGGGGGEEEEAKKRELQYRRGIGRLTEEVARVPLPLPHKIIIVENNGKRSTFLDSIPGVDEVVYTESNGSTDEKGAKELDDILAAVERLGMGEADILVKMTGRYYLRPPDGGGDSGSSDATAVPFMEALRSLDPTQTRALVKFGSYSRPRDYPVLDCVTGLIMLPVAAIRHIDRTVLPIERAWARAALSLPREEVLPIVGKMGIYIAPGGRKRYFLV